MTAGLSVWRLPESNWGHTDFQSVALPTELKRHLHNAVKNITKLMLHVKIKIQIMGIFTENAQEASIFHKHTSAPIIR